TTHSGPDSASESPRRSTRDWETIGLLRVPDSGYVGTPSCVATCTTTVSGVSETQNQETRSPLPPWSDDSSPGSPPIEVAQTGFGDAPTRAPAPILRHKILSQSDNFQRSNPLQPPISRVGIPLSVKCLRHNPA